MPGFCAADFLDSLADRSLKGSNLHRIFQAVQNAQFQNRLVVLTEQELSVASSQMGGIQFPFLRKAGEHIPDQGCEISAEDRNLRMRQFFRETVISYSA